MTRRRDEGFLAEAMPANTQRVTHAQFHTRPDGKKLAHHGAVSSVLHMLADRDKPTEVVKLPNGTEIRLSATQPHLARPDGYLSSYRAYFDVTKGGKTETVQGGEEATNLAIIVDAPTIKLTEADLAELNAERISEARIDVSSYVRKDGTFVAPYVQIRKLLSGLNNGQSIDTPDGLKVTKQKDGKFTVAGGSGKGATDTTFDDHTGAAQDLLVRSAGQKHPKALGGEENIRKEVKDVLPRIESQRAYTAQADKAVAGGNKPVRMSQRNMDALNGLVQSQVPTTPQEAEDLRAELKQAIPGFDPKRDPATYVGVSNGQQFPLFPSKGMQRHLKSVIAGIDKQLPGGKSPEGTVTDSQIRRMKIGATKEVNGRKIKRVSEYRWTVDGGRETVATVALAQAKEGGAKIEPKGDAMERGASGASFKPGDKATAKLTGGPGRPSGREIEIVSVSPDGEPDPKTGMRKKGIVGREADGRTVYFSHDQLSPADGMPKGAEVVTRDSKTGTKTTGTIAGKTADGKVAVKTDSPFNPNHYGITPSFGPGGTKHDGGSSLAAPSATVRKLWSGEMAPADVPSEQREKVAVGLDNTVEALKRDLASPSDDGPRARAQTQAHIDRFSAQAKELRRMGGGRKISTTESKRTPGGPMKSGTHEVEGMTVKVTKTKGGQKARVFDVAGNEVASVQQHDGPLDLGQVKKAVRDHKADKARGTMGPAPDKPKTPDAGKSPEGKLPDGIKQGAKVKVSDGVLAHTVVGPGKEPGTVRVRKPEGASMGGGEEIEVPARQVSPWGKNSGPDGSKPGYGMGSTTTVPTGKDPGRKDPAGTAGTETATKDADKTIVRSISPKGYTAMVTTDDKGNVTKLFVRGDDGKEVGTFTPTKPMTGSALKTEVDRIVSGDKGGGTGFVSRSAGLPRGFDADTGSGPKGVRGEVGDIGKVPVGIHQEGDTWYVSRFPGGKTVATGKTRYEALQSASAALEEGPGYGKGIGRNAKPDPEMFKKSKAELQSLANGSDASRAAKARTELNRRAAKRKGGSGGSTEKGTKAATGGAKVDQRYFRMGKAELQNLAGHGDAGAKRELARREKKRDGGSKGRELKTGGPGKDGKLRTPLGMDTPSDDLGTPKPGDSPAIKARRESYARLAKAIKSREGRLEDLSETQRIKLAADKRELKVAAANLRILLKR